MRRYLQTVLMEIMLFCVYDGDNSKNKVKKQLEDNSKVTTLGGTLSCGTDYDITANSKVEQ